MNLNTAVGLFEFGENRALSWSRRTMLFLAFTTRRVIALVDDNALPPGVGLDSFASPDASKKRDVLGTAMLSRHKRFQAAVI